MSYRRAWNRMCPRVWDCWLADKEIWVVQDLRPTDAEAAVDILTHTYFFEETLSKACNLRDDPISVEGIKKILRKIFLQRMSLGCYIYYGHFRILVAVNACYVICKNEDMDWRIDGVKANTVFNTFAYMENQYDIFGSLCVDKYLRSFGVGICYDFRNLGIEKRFVIGRERLSLYYGIDAISSLCTDMRSQVIAADLNHDPVYEQSVQDLVEVGFDYPREDTVIVLMVKRHHLSDL